MNKANAAEEEAKAKREKELLDSRAEASRTKGKNPLKKR